ncbi:MAG: glycosyltransferase [Calditrichaeota bacterium]|nr:glycosyltransferase [Calditrichota bacterium]
MRQGLRIAFIDHSHELGGAEHLLLTLIDGLPRERFEPIIITPREGPFTQEARKRNIRTLVFPLPPFWSQSLLFGTRKLLNPLAACWNAINMLYSAWKLQRVLRQEDIDLVQTNSTFAHIYGGVAARLAGSPCIWYFHDLVEPDRLMGAIAGVWRVLAALLDARVVAVSRAALQALSVGERGIVIYPGKTLDDTPSLPGSLRRKINVPEGGKPVVFVGRISYSKGLDILADAASRVIKRDPAVHFVILGDAGERDISYRHFLMSILSQRQLLHHWHWMGYVKHANRLIAEAALLVLPSRREALSLVLIEAGLAQKAVVASRVGGIPEVVVDGKTGLLVPAEDPVALADAILRLVEDTELATQMGQQAFKHVRQVFSLARYHEKFLALYDSLQGRQQAYPVRP